MNDVPDGDFVDHVEGAMTREFMLSTFLAASSLPETATDWQRDFETWATRQPRRYTIEPAPQVGGRDALRVSALSGCAVQAPADHCKPLAR